MRFLVLNRDNAEKFTCGEPYIHICITDPNDTLPKLIDSRNQLFVLYLSFHDWDLKAKSHIQRMKTPEAKKMVYFSKEHARRIISAIRFFDGLVNLVVINCAAGISRSPAVAAALSKCMTGDDTFFFKKYIPNSLVYSTIVKEWNNGKA